MKINKGESENGFDSLFFCQKQRKGKEEREEGGYFSPLLPPKWTISVHFLALTLLFLKNCSTN